jgi:hypothetical protein
VFCMMDWHTAVLRDSGISDNSVGVVQNVRAIMAYGPWIFRRHWDKRSVPGSSQNSVRHVLYVIG